MKISKVDHTREAVTKSEWNGTRGMLYKDPTEGKTESLEERISGRIQAAQKLYNILNPVSPEKKEERELRTLVSDINKDLAALLFENSRPRRVRRKDDILDDLQYAYGARHVLQLPADQEKLDEICALYLRRGLRDGEQGLRIILTTQGKTLTEVEEKEVNHFLVVLCKDFYKEGNSSNSKALARSIQNQNIPVQPKQVSAKTPAANTATDAGTSVQRAGASVRNRGNLTGNSSGKSTGQSSQNQTSLLFGIAHSRQESARDKEEKAGLEHFMTAYADLHEEERTRMLRKLRRLLDLYFYAKEKETIPDEINRSDDFDVWELHEERKGNTDDFVDAGSLKTLIHAEEAWKEKVQASDRNSPEGKEARAQLKRTKAQEKKALQVLQEDIRRRNMECYRLARAAADRVNQRKEAGLFFADSSINHFWIHHFEAATERILAGINGKKLYKLQTGYLSEKVWKDALNYLSVKYIAVGKAVFNYTGLADTIQNGVEAQKEVNLCAIVPAAQKGISSFDYEMIKAHETLQREVSVAVAFAANNLARATVDTTGKDKEDFLQFTKEDLTQNRQDETSGATLRAILQFFGGSSAWDTEVFRKTYSGQEDGTDFETAFLADLQQNMNVLRNQSFHFRSARHDQPAWNTAFVADMFDQEAARCVSIEKERFYTNNLPVFYASNDLKSILDRLYKTNHSRASQVPSFNTVFVRNAFPAYLNDELKCHPALGAEDMAKWQSAIYYLLKEIYYNAFLADQEVKAYFYEALDQLSKEVKEAENTREARYAHKNDNKAMDDFRLRCSAWRNDPKYNLSTICQMLMTEYNLQNSDQRKVVNNPKAEREPIFQHYKMLLMKTLRRAFTIFVKKEEEFRFIYDGSKIRVRENVPQEDQFLPGWTAPMYQVLAEQVRREPELQSWYITCRFLNGRMLSHLAGSLRTYIQYEQDIERRAAENNTRLIRKETEEVNRIKAAVQVVDFCTKLASSYSAEFSDYFANEDAYAEYLDQNYVDFYDETYRRNHISPFKALTDFCCEGETKYDVYANDQKPILNRNIIEAKLFGPDNIIAAVYDRVKREDLAAYYELKKRTTEYLSKGLCENGTQQQEVLQFQRLKNHVELRDAEDYGEIINELLGQLIGWSYLRERDLMYFQLGFHYLCLYNDAEKPAEYSCITEDHGRKMQGAILLQIAGMYVNGLGIFAPEDDTKKKEHPENRLAMQGGNKSAGGNISSFFQYSRHLQMTDNSLQKYGKDFVYCAGLELFENVKEHDSIIEVRNAIDHFKYYLKFGGKQEMPANGKKNVLEYYQKWNDMSLLDYYSEVFDRFFTYDMKYQKNVINMLTNILARHFLLLYPEISTGIKEIKQGKQTLKKERAQIGIQQKGLQTDYFTYKLRDGDTVRADARDVRFRRTIAKILYFPHEVPEGVVDESTFFRDPEDPRSQRKEINRPAGDGRGSAVGRKGRSAGMQRGNQNLSAGSRRNNAQRRQNSYASEDKKTGSDRLTYNPFAGIKLSD